jgi:hypothetical protein
MECFTLRSNPLLSAFSEFLAGIFISRERWVLRQSKANEYRIIDSKAGDDHRS